MEDAIKKRYKELDVLDVSYEQRNIDKLKKNRELYYTFDEQLEDYSKKIKDLEKDADKFDAQSKFYEAKQKQIELLKQERINTYSDRENLKKHLEQDTNEMKNKMLSEIKEKMSMIEEYGTNNEARVTDLANLQEKQKELQTKIDSIKSKVINLEDCMKRTSDQNYKDMYAKQLNVAANELIEAQKEYSQNKDKIELLNMPIESFESIYLKLQEKKKDIEDNFSIDNFEDYVSKNVPEQEKEDDKTNDDNDTKTETVEHNQIPKTDNDTIEEKQEDSQKPESTNPETTTKKENKDKSSFEFPDIKFKPINEDNGKLENIKISLSDSKATYKLKYGNEEDRHDVVSSKYIKYEQYGDYYFEEYKEMLKTIKEKYNLDQKTLKKIDPYLISMLDDKNAKSLIEKFKNNKMITDPQIKYDMKNIKDLSAVQRFRYRRIAREAIKSGIEVENFKDVWYREIAKKIKNVPQMFKEKEEPKKLAKASEDTKNKKTLKEKAHDLKLKAIYGYMKIDNKIGEKYTDISGKLKNKISERKNKKNITKHQQFAQSVHVPDLTKSEEKARNKAIAVAMSKKTLKNMDEFLTRVSAGKSDDYFDRITMQLKPEYSEKFHSMMNKVNVDILDKQSQEKYRDLQLEYDIEYMNGTIYDKDGKLYEKLKQMKQDRHKKIKDYIKNNKSRDEMAK